MSNTAKAPKPVIERESDREREGAAADRGETPRSGATRFHDATVGFFAGMGRRAWSYADAHPNTVLYGGIGLLLAALILCLGLWRTIVISVFVGIGAAIGQFKDGDGGIYRLLKRIFGGRR